MIRLALLLILLATDVDARERPSTSSRPVATIEPYRGCDHATLR
jgi:hypothetical protein